MFWQVPLAASPSIAVLFACQGSARFCSQHQAYILLHSNNPLTCSSTFPSTCLSSGRVLLATPVSSSTSISRRTSRSLPRAEASHRSLAHTSSSWLPKAARTPGGSADSRPECTACRCEYRELEGGGAHALVVSAGKDYVGLVISEAAVKGQLVIATHCC